MQIILTGVAGFIGMSTALRLLERGDTVIGIDNLNDYYDVNLKKNRLLLLAEHQNFKFIQLDIFNGEKLLKVFLDHNNSSVIHLAAQAGVRYSVNNPAAYSDSNLTGFINILEGCRAIKTGHLVYASSSSVYGGNTKLPFMESDKVDHPVSLYAATKKANELMAHTYSHLFKIPTTGLRFFTVYGPWGRPDMSPHLFSNAIINGLPLKLYNHGQMTRDFTYIDDVTESIIRILDKPASPSEIHNNRNPQPHISNAPYRIFNVGNDNSQSLIDYVTTLEKAWGMTAEKQLLPMQSGDVQNTASSSTALKDWIGFSPQTKLEQGINKFVEWYKDYYKVG